MQKRKTTTLRVGQLCEPGRTRIAVIVFWGLAMIGPAGAGCDEDADKVEKKAKEVKKRAGRAAREAGQGAQLMAKDALKGGKKAARKLHRRASRWAQEGGEATARAIETAKQKARDVSDVRLCKKAYDYFVKCWPKEAKKFKKTQIVTKCSAAVAGGNEMIRKLLHCLEESAGQCKKVKACVPDELLKVLASG
jgi:F0F1-type ATP synthase membrane subunit b/b'